MDSDKLNELIQKYWSVETTLEEEQQLHEFFKREPVPEALRETAKLFQYFEEQKKLKLDDSMFDNRLKGKIKPEGKVISMLQMARIAAGLFVVVAATFFIREEVRKAFPDEPVDTYSDPKVAFEETKKALMMISNSFNKAKSEANKINVFNEAQEKIHRPDPSHMKEVSDDKNNSNI